MKMSHFAILRGKITERHVRKGLVTGRVLTPILLGGDETARVTQEDFAAISQRRGVYVGYAQDYGRVIVHVMPRLSETNLDSYQIPQVVVSFLDTARVSSTGLVTICMERFHVPVGFNAPTLRQSVSAFLSDREKDGTAAFIHQFVFKSRMAAAPAKEAPTKRAWETKRKPPATPFLSIHEERISNLLAKSLSPTYCLF